MRRLLSRFWSDRSGNIALIFGLRRSVLGAMGAAVDYSVECEPHGDAGGLDNTALTLSKQMPLSQSVLNTNGWNIFTGNLVRARCDPAR